MYVAIVDAEARVKQEEGPCAEILPEVLKDVAWNQHINMHTHKLEVGGVISQPGNRFVLFVRASARGEAKLRGRVRGDEV